MRSFGQALGTIWDGRWSVFLWCMCLHAFMTGTAVMRNPDPLGNLFGCNDPCIVQGNPGGNALFFSISATAVLNQQKVATIDGPCYSACALFADLARERVCITKRAEFGFHTIRLSLWSKDLPTIPIPFRPFNHSRDIGTWVENNGGFPLLDLTIMSYKEARQFWPTCPIVNRAPKKDLERHLTKPPLR